VRGSRRGILGFQGLCLLLLLDLEQEGAVDVRQDTSKGDGGADEGIELFVTSDGQLKMARGDTLDLEILGCVLHRWLVLQSSESRKKEKLTPASSRTSAVRYSRTAVT
jgi:hypothetical protein